VLPQQNIIINIWAGLLCGRKLGLGWCACGMIDGLRSWGRCVALAWGTSIGGWAFSFSSLELVDV
tara:strand:- start:230 stop:424 length:195 start_codon:yes stop_codon:yes gene_type:complete